MRMQDLQLYCMKVSKIILRLLYHECQKRKLNGGHFYPRVRPRHTRAVAAMPAPLPPPHKGAIVYLTQVRHSSYAGRDSLGMLCVSERLTDRSIDTDGDDQGGGLRH